MDSETLQCVFQIVQWVLKLFNAFFKSFNGHLKLFNAFFKSFNEF